MGTVSTGGNVYENAIAEDIFVTLEYALITKRIWQSKVQAKTATFTWIESGCNPRRCPRRCKINHL